MFVINKVDKKKLTTNSSKEFKYLDKIATELEPMYQSSLIKGINGVKKQVSPNILLRDFQNRDIKGAVERIPFDDLKTEIEAIEPLTKEGMIKAGKAMEGFIPTVGKVKFAFNAANPAIDSFLKNTLGELIQEISGESRLAVENAIRVGFDKGVTANKLAELIPKTIGLNDRQATALINYERKLTEAGVKGKELISKVNEYEQEMLEYRTKMIARTESMRAVNEGHRLTVEQAIEDGVVKIEDTKKRWRTTLDDRTSENHRRMNNKTVPYEKPFNVDGGEFFGPITRPNCRCVLTYEFKD